MKKPGLSSAVSAGYTRITRLCWQSWATPWRRAARWKTALSAYRAAVELEPRQADYWRLLAGFSAGYEYLLREVGLPAARRAAALDPDDPANLDMLGQVLLLLQDFANAERTFQRAVQADPGYAPGHVHLGLIYILRDERSRAREKWGLVLELAPGTPAADQAQRLMENYFP